LIEIDLSVKFEFFVYTHLEKKSSLCTDHFYVGIVHVSNLAHDSLCVYMYFKQLWKKDRIIVCFHYIMEIVFIIRWKLVSLIYHVEYW